MASLTHVCMWTDSGWERITAERAAALHPGGTVSARSGLFMCDLCGQYVVLTDGEIRGRYFKHSAYEKSKDCPERTFGANCSISYDPQKHNLPIRIVVTSSTAFRFEIGLVRVPECLLTNDLRIEIAAKGANGNGRIYARERLNDSGVTYLPVGEEPFEACTLIIRRGDEKLRDFWPSETEGIDSEGTFFYAETGNMLPRDADIEVGREYFLLTCGAAFAKPDCGLQICKIAKKRVGQRIWVLYTVCASELNEDAARFFLNFHSRLTDCPVSLLPLWPPFVEGDHVVRHSENSIYVLAEGNAATVGSFPPPEPYLLSPSESRDKLYRVLCSGRQQLISAGRTHPLRYFYFWKDSLDQVRPYPEVSVTNLTGTKVEPGETSILPPRKTLCFESSFDGEIAVLSQSQVVDKRKIKAGKRIELDGLSYGLSVRAVVGLDIVWQIVFLRTKSTVEKNDSEILKALNSGTAPFIPVPHSLANILKGMNEYRLVCQWIRECIAAGVISERSYRVLQKTYRDLNMDR